VSKDPTEELIAPFFTNFRYSLALDVPTMIRFLVAEKKFMMVAIGLRANQDIVAAVVAAAKEDPVSAFDVIPMDEDPEVKKRCAIRVLRSLTRASAEAVAKKLVENYGGAGVDVPALFQHLPDGLSIAQLGVILAEFTKTKTETAAEQRKSFDGSKDGIFRAQKLEQEKPPFISTLGSTELCEKCKTPLLQERGLVYPCGHVIHSRCADKIAELAPTVAGDKPIRMAADCPFCGFLSVRMLGAPFTNPRGEGDANPWTTDKDQLMRLADDSKWRLLGAMRV
jgi:hypothetical protein